MKMEYLVQCSDKSYCILYEHQIIVEDENASLEPGEEVSFSWKVNAKKTKLYKGVILQRDVNAEVLHATMQRLGDGKSGHVLDKEQVNKTKPRKNAVTVLEKSIYEELKNSSKSSEQDSTVESKCKSLLGLRENILEEIENFKQIVSKKFDSYLVQPRGDESQVNKNDCRRSLGMPGSPSEKITPRRRSLGMPEESNWESQSKKLKSSTKSNKFDSSLVPLKSNKVQVEQSRRSLSMPEENDWECSLKKLDSEMNIINSDSESNDKDSELLSPLFKTKFGEKLSLIYSEDESDDNLQSSSKSFKLPENQTDRLIKVEKKNDFSADDQNKKDDFPAAGQEEKKKFEEKNQFNPEDPNSCLMYKKTDANVEELVKYSGIYADVFEVKKAVVRSKTANELARALMRIVFKKEALDICSMFGKQAKGRGKTEEIKPGLNENGVEAIIQFSQKQAKKLSWPECSRTAIIKSMSSKLTETHSTKKSSK